MVSFQPPNICEQLEVGGGGGTFTMEQIPSRLRGVWDYFLIISYCTTFMYNSDVAEGPLDECRLTGEYSLMSPLQIRTVRQDRDHPDCRFLWLFLHPTTSSRPVGIITRLKTYQSCRETAAPPTIKEL